MKIKRLVLASIYSAALLGAAAALSAADYPIQPVPLTDVRFTGGLLHNRQATNDAVTIPFVLDKLESEGRLRNFDLAAEVMRRRAAGETNFQIRPPTQYTFDDTDVYKTIEGAAFSLALRPDPALAARLERYISRVAAAQEPDGYLFTFRTMHPDSPGHGWVGRQRWEREHELSHELYNLGHLFEAGVAHYQATGSRTLLAICLKAAELLYYDFGDGQPRISPGHQGIEMGLVKLHRQTGDPRWLNLARFFLEVRGTGGEYSQDHKPVLQQDRAVGHAVRANYMYAGMVDVAALTGDMRYFDAAARIWTNVVHTKYYLAGGCGARAAGEAYGDEYELPHRGYNEVCAALAFLFWNHRMFLMTGHAQHMDVFERSLYNAALAGVSVDGDGFFYPSPLEYDGHSRINHGHAGRAPWFGCACCPPNVLRVIASLGKYAYAVKGDKLFVNLYAQGDATATVAGNRVGLSQTTDYPWNGEITLRVTPETPGRFTLALRIPGWVQGRPVPGDLYTYDDPAPAGWTLEVNGAPVRSPEIGNGFALVTRTWRSGDVVRLDLPMPVRRVAGHPNVASTTRQVALERGPVVYAFEGLDNDGSVFDAVIPASATITAEHRPDFLGGVTVLKVDGAKRAFRAEGGEIQTKPARLLAIPYKAWANRALSPMGVWIAREAAIARPPAVPTLVSQARVSVSNRRGGMSLGAINDQLMPQNFTDGFAPGFDFWPRMGTSEWIAYEFPQPATIRAVRVSWFDDSVRGGGCRVPASWRVLYRAADGQWAPVRNAGDYAVQCGRLGPVRVAFDAVTTTALRLEIQSRQNYSSGIYEWEAEEVK